MIDRAADPSIRARILRTGLELMGSQGYAATSVAQICKQSGTHVGSIYHHFGNKAGLLGAILEAGARRLVENINRTEELRGAGAIEALFLGAADAVLEEILFYRLTLFLVLEDIDDEEFTSTILRFRAEIDTAISAMIEPYAQEAGAVDPAEVAREATEFTLELTRGAVVSERFSAAEFRVAMARNAKLVELYLRHRAGQY